MKKIDKAETLETVERERERERESYTLKNKNKNINSKKDSKIPILKKIQVYFAIFLFAWEIG